MSAEEACPDTGDTACAAEVGAPDPPGGLWFACGLRPEPVGAWVVVLALLLGARRRA